MADYIDRGSITRTAHILRPEDKERVSAISSIPAADVAPVRYGLWKPVYESEATGWNPEFAGHDPIFGYVCSECGKEAVYDCNDEPVLSAYCPHCGSRMGGAE